jgi:hypothetical protein
MSVYIDREWCIWSRSEDKLSHRVVVQSLSQMLCPFSTDIVPCKIESDECLYWSIMVYMQSSEDKLSYRIVVQCLGQMLCPFSTNIVPIKIESGECLYWLIMVYMQSIRRQILLLCCCAMLGPDVVPLQHRYCCPKDWERRVSILIDNGVYAVDQKTNCLTVLLCSTWARCCAPSAPILFHPRLRVMSIYIDR